jgi:hypothetical protein
MPNLAPSNSRQPSGNLQPSGRVVTFQVQNFTGQGDPVAVARQALSSVPWADRNDIEFDRDSNKLRIGQLGGSVNTQQAKEPLETAGFEFAPGVSVGPKKK